MLTMSWLDEDRIRIDFRRSGGVGWDLSLRGKTSWTCTLHICEGEWET